MRTEHQEAREKLAVFALVSALLDGIEAGGEMGAPEGILYAGLMGAGVKLHHFEQARESLVKNEYVTRAPGPCLVITDKGKQVASSLRKALGES